MSTKFFNNKEGNTLYNKFEGVFKYNPHIHQFDALVGYFRSSGYFKVRKLLIDRVPQVRILVGINVNKLTQEAHQRGMLFLGAANKTKAQFMEEVLEDIEKANYDKETEEGILQFIEDIIEKRIVIKAHPEKKLHAKIYIFKPEPFNQHTHGAVITGSSNLTDSGIGTATDSNYEFNVLLTDYDDVKFASDEFEELWKEAVDILPVDAQEIKRKSYLKDDFTPFELYIKMLIEYFGRRIEYDPYNIEMLLPDKYKKLKYQSDAASQGYAIMMKHNGFILGDVVGLGKTIVACMVIKKFIYETGTNSRILVVCPPAILSAWKRTAIDFQIENLIDFISLGSLSKVLDENNFEYLNANRYDLVVVDESHKFRNHSTEQYKKLQSVCKIARSRPGENGDIKKKVILISATPLNNRPEDIENQLYLFQNRRNSTLENCRNLQDYFKNVNERYKRLSSETPLNLSKLRHLFNQLRNDVIEPLVIRRTRKDIENEPEYLADLKCQNIIFPKVKDPIALRYEFNHELSLLFFETVSMITGMNEDGNHYSEGLNYYRYRAIEFLSKKEDRDLYGNVESISNRLEAIMRIMMVKRLESSFHAFKSSLTRLQKAYANMIEMFENNTVFIAPDLDINKLLEDGLTYEQIEEKIANREGNSNNRIFHSSDFSETFIELLKQDKKKVDVLLAKWKQISYDPKLEKFSNEIKNTFFNEKTNPSHKLVIFTESKETADEICIQLKKDQIGKVLCISSENRDTSEKYIRLNFDANLDLKEWQYDYDVIVTTEVLAEGVNLHRSNVIINYDVPWNSTRLMQRIGRVNRIGSTAEFIYVYNFYPSDQGNAQINLINTALRKLQAFHTAFGEDNRIFSLLEEVGDGALYGNKIHEEVNEINKYLTELREFRKINPQWFKDINRIPNKSRTCRSKNYVKEDAIPVFDMESGAHFRMESTTVSYLKSDNHPGIFYLVTPDEYVKELTFLEAVNLFKTSREERAILLHGLHYKQTEKAYEEYRTDRNQQAIRSINKKDLSNVENKALSNISFVVKHASGAQQKNTLSKVIEVIKQGTFGSRGLPKDINDFFAKNSILLGKSAMEFIDKLFSELLDKFNFNTEQDISAEESESIVNPKIVLSLSFS